LRVYCLIPDTKIAEIRERADIAEVVGEYVTLRRAGSNLKGVCPFHADKDPSFNVNPARQFYHCFGCAASGDVFSFLQRMEGIGFTEAATRLANRYNITLPERPISKEARSREERRREATRRRRYILAEAEKFFVEMLATPAGEAGRRLIADRGIDTATVEKYHLGYAPESWSALIDHMSKARVGPAELEEVGLVKARRTGDGYYDFFRHRLIFSVSDPAGQPIAFSGRALADGKDDIGAKYINTKETPEYTKGKTLYGLHQARVPLSKSGEAVLVEGNFDVIAMAQAGVENVVAPLGTAMTREQAVLLRNRVERVIVMFDGDDAGRKAAAKTFPLLAGAGLASYVVLLPRGEDPDSYVREKGPEAVNTLLSKRTGLLDQIISGSAAGSDGSAQDTARRISNLKPYFDLLRTPMEADLYRQKAASAFGVDLDTVFRFFRGGPALSSSATSQNDGGDAPLPGRVEERELVGLLLDNPDICEQVVNGGIVSMVSTPAFRTLINEMISRIERKESSIAELVSQADGDPIGPWFAKRALVCLYPETEKAEKALKDIGKKLAKTHLKGEIVELEKQIQLANAQGNDALVLELSRKKTNLQRDSEIGKLVSFDENTAKA
jgi:DNA primase